MKALKALVIFMGVLIVAGIGLVIYGVASKVGPKTTAAAPHPATIPAAAPVAAFADIEIALPPGDAVQEIVGAGERVIVRTGPDPKTTRRLLVIDPAHGRIIGSVSFVPVPETGATR